MARKAILGISIEFLASTKGRLVYIVVMKRLLNDIIFLRSLMLEYVFIHIYFISHLLFNTILFRRINSG
jgi:hypothetical protein